MGGSACLKVKHGKPRSLAFLAFACLFLPVNGDQLRQAVVFTLSGQRSGAAGYIDSAKGSSAAFDGPVSLAVDAVIGDVFVADTGNDAIRQVATGMAATMAAPTSTVCGNGSSGYTEGTGTQALMRSPYGIAVKMDGSIIYFSDFANHRIRYITASTGLSQLFAGQAAAGFANGLGSNAQFSNPAGVALNSSFIYIADSGNNCIRRVSPLRLVTTYAGLCGASGTADGVGSNSRFNFPTGLSISSNGTLYVSDTGNHNIRAVFPGGTVEAIAGISAPGFVDGLIAASFNTPMGVAVYDNDDVLFVADSFNNRVRVIDLLTRNVSTYAGNGSSRWGDGPTASKIAFMSPKGVAVDARGIVYVTEGGGNRVRSIVTCGTPGYYCSGGSPIPKICVAGRFCPAKNGTAVPCPAGTWSDALGATTIATCNSCAGGTYCPQNSTAPVMCPGGYFCPPMASGPPFICPRGTYCVSRSASPKACPGAPYDDCPAGTEFLTLNINSTMQPMDIADGTLIAAPASGCHVNLLVAGGGGGGGFSASGGNGAAFNISGWLGPTSRLLASVGGGGNSSSSSKGGGGGGGASSLWLRDKNASVHDFSLILVAAGGGGGSTNALCKGGNGGDNLAAAPSGGCSGAQGGSILFPGAADPPITTNEPGEPPEQRYNRPIRDAPYTSPGIGGKGGGGGVERDDPCWRLRRSMGCARGRRP